MTVFTKKFALTPKYLPFSLLFALLLLFGVACGDSADENPQDHGVFTSKSGHFQAHLTPTPNPPISGDNTLQIHLMDADGAAVTQATLHVTPFMPGHGHGTHATPTVEERGDGVYDVSNIVYTMPGRWELTIDIDHAQHQDQIVAGYDVK